MIKSGVWLLGEGGHLSYHYTHTLKQTGATGQDAALIATLNTLNSSYVPQFFILSQKDEQYPH